MATGPWQAQALTAGGVFHAADVANLIRAVNYLQGLPLSGDDERPMANLRQGVAQSIPNNALTPLLLDTEYLDTANGHSTTTNTSRWTCPAGKAGWYWVKGAYVAVPNGTGDRSGCLLQNGNTRYGQTSTVPSAIRPTSLIFVDLMFFAAGDYVETCGYQSSGGALATDLTTNVSMSLSQMRMQ
jgi:hypothetical protein